MRVAVIGGGLAGLAAAVELKARGAHVELFERARLLGGRATSFEVGEHVVDNGQHVFLACCTEFIAFVERLGMGDALWLQDRFDVVTFERGTRSRLRAADLPAPLHLIASFAGYRHLRLSAKLRVARALLALRNPGAVRRGENFSAWLSRNGQNRETIDRFWAPFLVPALNAPLDGMSAEEAAFVIAKAFLSDRDAGRFGFARVPLVRIMERAAQGLDAVHQSCAVFKAEVHPDGVSVLTADRRLSFDAMVAAVSPRALNRLLDDPASLGIPPLDAYEAFPIVDAHLWHDAGRLSFDFAALLGSPVQWVFQKADGYLCCSMSAAGDVAAKANSDVVALAWREVTAAIPELARASLREGAATRNPEGTYLAKAEAARPGPGTALPHVALAGAWIDTGWPDTMESAVRSGLAAARTLAQAPRAAATA